MRTKKPKKFLALLLALVLTTSFSLPVFAAGTEYTVTIENEAEGHTYEAYQIFKGDLSDTGILSNIEWGDSVDGSGLLAALKSADNSKYGECDSAASVAEALSGGEDAQATAADAEAFAEIADSYLTTAKGSADTLSEGKYTIPNLPAGYYLVKDKDNSLEGSAETYTNYIVRVVADVEVQPKTGDTTSEKKVKDKNDSAGEETGWQDSADYDIGDRVPFQLTASLPANYSTYSEYALTFHDTECAGLDFQPDTVKVYIDGYAATAGYTLEESPDDGCTFEIVFTDLKTVAAEGSHQAGNNSVVTVEYESVLTDGAVIGALGNPNTVYTTFSNNPNGEGQGRTPDDTVIVFTYKVVIDKVNQDQEALDGAGFTLEKKIKGDSADTWETVKVIDAAEALTQFVFSGLDDGVYRLTESTTPQGFNTMEPVEFTVYAEHGETLTSLSGNAVTGEITFTAAPDEGSLAATVVNQQGAELPETGGVGTTVFYVAGGILIASAGILLIVRRRMKNEGQENN